ncbi:MAG: hypothetical protein JSU65_02025 [Candidatus Zixiibacteriota bacterium]|nr:MAG: hypothetical protein JSU65_02025 [candidate division Zixibacteria bacterium]
MGLRIATNVSNTGVLYQLAAGFNAMTKHALRLSSGLRINSAADDPAGLVISEQLRCQIRSLGQEIDNLSANINRYRTVSSSVGQLRSQLTELRRLAIGAANEGGNSEAAQAAYDTAARDIVASFNATVKNAEYNGAKTLDGSEGSLVSISELTGIDLSTSEAAEASIGAIDEAISELDSAQIELGSTQKNELESRKASLEVTRQNLTAAESQIRDIDFAQEYSGFISSVIRTQTAMAMLAHHSLTGASVLKLFQ